MKQTLRVLAAAGAISAAVCGSAAAQSYAADYFAVVNTNGDTVRSSGVFASARSATGLFEVLFNREDLSACAFTASLSGPNPGLITAQGGNPNKVIVRTFSRTGAAANRAFHVMVTCAPGASQN
jgi:hypothetical protein